MANRLLGALKAEGMRTLSKFGMAPYLVQLMDARNKPISIHYCGRLNSGVQNAASRFPSIREPVDPVGVFLCATHAAVHTISDAVLQTTDCPRKKWCPGVRECTVQLSPSLMPGNPYPGFERLQLLRDFIYAFHNICRFGLT
uniref:Uncharacterized protein n=1 Tax=Coccidioides posadasii RMSCC 3488 TaxID=454284 RepID=A0A0J6F5K9_COCPO|nr:hypothetical protein CPAG_01829 [Coccidioides posadasii RMSCC 3488]